VDILTDAQKEKLAFEIRELLKKHRLIAGVRIFFNNKCLEPGGKVTDNVRGSDSFDHAIDDTIAMTFTGKLDEVINYHDPARYDKVMPKFEKILAAYGLYFELWSSWNLSTYYLDPPPGYYKEIPEGESRTKPISIDKSNCPVELEPIRAEWEKRQDEYGDAHGDEGNCVIGAWFRFKFDGLYYRMSPQGHFQGSITWETSKDTIEQMLKDAGCEDVEYDYGRMD
jgi:hypothetical protein